MENGNTNTPIPGTNGGKLGSCPLSIPSPPCQNPACTLLAGQRTRPELSEAQYASLRENLLESIQEPVDSILRVILNHGLSAGYVKSFSARSIDFTPFRSEAMVGSKGFLHHLAQYCLADSDKWTSRVTDYSIEPIADARKGWPGCHYTGSP